MSDRALILAVHDDGRGGAARTSGIGLSSMLERADEIGGTVEVCSPGLPEQGTRVTLTLPLEVQA